MFAVFVLYSHILSCHESPAHLILSNSFISSAFASFIVVVVVVEGGGGMGVLRLIYFFKVYSLVHLRPSSSFHHKLS